MHRFLFHDDGLKSLASLLLQFHKRYLYLELINLSVFIIIIPILIVHQISYGIYEISFQIYQDLFRNLFKLFSKFIQNLFEIH